MIQIELNAWSFAPDRLLADERERIRITPGERALFHRLGALAARSPRAVKRMINIYRLLRVQSTWIDELLYLIDADGAPVHAPLVQFALACEAGLPARSFAKIARQVETMQPFEWDRWRKSAATLSTDAIHVRDALRGDKVRITAFFGAFRDAERELGRDMFVQELQAAFALAGRYSFRKAAAPLGDQD